MKGNYVTITEGNMGLRVSTKARMGQNTHSSGVLCCCTVSYARAISREELLGVTLAFGIVNEAWVIETIKNVIA